MCCEDLPVDLLAMRSSGAAVWHDSATAVSGKNGAGEGASKGNRGKLGRLLPRKPATVAVSVAVAGAAAFWACHLFRFSQYCSLARTELTLRAPHSPQISHQPCTDLL